MRQAKTTLTAKSGHSSSKVDKNCKMSLLWSFRAMRKRFRFCKRHLNSQNYRISARIEYSPIKSKILQTALFTADYLSLFIHHNGFSTNLDTQLQPVYCAVDSFKGWTEPILHIRCTVGDHDVPSARFDTPLLADVLKLVVDVHACLNSERSCVVRYNVT